MAIPCRFEVTFAVTKSPDQLILKNPKLPDFLPNRADLFAQQIADVGARFSLVLLKEEQLANLRK